VILGAGPTGLGAAWRLQELGYDRWELFEAESHAGGLSASFSDAQGFVWDLGVHVLHSHYPYFNRLLDQVLPDAVPEHERDSSIWLKDRFVPYPLQSHIGHLTAKDRERCIAGLREASRAHDGTTPKDFERWILQQFGQGIADIFMLPYNRKVWACEPKEMGVHWIGERVAQVDPAAILREAQRQSTHAWGPNAVFRYPRRGGIGAIWNAIFERLAEQRVHLGRRVVQIDRAKRIVTFADGATTGYDKLVSTLPLDRLVALSDDTLGLETASAQLRYSSLHAIGLGLEGKAPEGWKTKSWVYFPQTDLVFQRITVISSYAPQSAADPDHQWLLQAEVTEPRKTAVDSEQLIAQTVAGLRNVGAVPPEADIVSTFHRRLEYAYPTPSKTLPDVLHRMLPVLEESEIFSRGRFGAWRYEIGNMDHCFAQGVEVANRIVLGKPEQTLRSREQ
jgi:protoporphyrinogen oxidase